MMIALPPHSARSGYILRDVYSADMPGAWMRVGVCGWTCCRLLTLLPEPVKTSLHMPSSGYDEYIRDAQCQVSPDNRKAV